MHTLRIFYLHLCCATQRAHKPAKRVPTALTLPCFFKLPRGEHQREVIEVFFRTVGRYPFFSSCSFCDAKTQNTHVNAVALWSKVVQALRSKIGDVGLRVSFSG